MKHSPHKYWPIFFCIAIVLFGMHLPLLSQASLYIVAILGWYIKSQKEGKGSLNLPMWLFFLAVAIVIGTRVYPFLSGHPAPLGYDTGIYKFEFEQAFKNLPGFSMGIHPGLFLLGDMLHLFGATSDFLMREGFIISSVLIVIMVFLTAKEYFGKNAGILASLIYAFSNIQFDAYTYVLYKNTIGISFLLLSLILIRRRSYLLLPIGLFLAILQPTHFLILGGTLFCMWIWNWRNVKDRIFFLVHGCMVGALALGVFLLNTDLIIAAINLLKGNDPLKEGVFLGFAEGIDRLSLYIPIAVLGIIHGIREKKNQPLIISTVLVGLIVILRLFFFRRYLIEFDVLLITFAGAGLARIINKIFSRKYYIGIFSMVCVMYITLHVAHVAYYQPFISHSELLKIQVLCSTTEENTLVMSTHSYYSPWLRGFSCREVFAPGLFERNTWPREQWDIFWGASPEERLQLMKKTFDGERIYIFVGEQQVQLNFDGMEGFTKLDKHLWRWN